MQILVTGFLVSMVLWTLIAIAALQVSVKLHREAGLSEKWLLVVPFLFTSFLFLGIRYRLVYWVMSRQAAHELFSIGANSKADLITLVVCLPVLYMISVLRPNWVVRTWVNLPLLVLLPFAIKLALYLTGVAGWDVNPAHYVPTRVE